MRNPFKSTLYIRLLPTSITLLHVESGREYSDIPQLAIEHRDGRSSIVAAGREAALRSGAPNITIENGFEHPRTLIADFTIAEQTLRHFIKRVLPKSLFNL
jgi:rod shape-determining protein MreB and related proteins